MDMVGKERKRKAATKLSDAGWKMDEGSDCASRAHGLWIYSFNLKTGARLAGQMTIEGFRAMGSGELLESACGLPPADILGAALTHYDSLTESQHSAEESQQLLSALALYASSTRSFEALPKDIPSETMHFMVFDWMTSGGSRVLRPAAAIDDSPVSPEALEAVSEQVLEIHLAKLPLELPV